MKTAIVFALCLAASVAAAQAPPSTPPRAPHIVLVGDSTVTDGSGWGLGFRQLVAPEVVVINTAQNGRSSKSFRDEGHWAKAIALRGDYYLIQFGHNDQPGKGPERETDPATTFPANLARDVDDVRAIGATPILVTSLVRRTFAESDPARLTSTLGPWVEAVKRVAAEKRVPLIDLDAASRALCERLGPVQTAGFNLRKDDGTTYTAEWTSLQELINHGDAAPAQAALIVGTRVVVTGNPLRDPAQIRASFPTVSISNTNVVDVIQIRRSDASWSWAQAAPECK